MSKLFCGSALLVVMSFFMGSCSMVRSFPHSARHRHTTTLVPSRSDTSRSSATPSSITAFVPLPAPDTSGMAVAEKITLPVLMEQAAPLFLRRTAFTTFTCKARVNFEGPEDSKEFNANIRIRKDSAIWVAISTLGLQVARVLITTDSFYMVVPLQREGTRLSLAHVAKVLPAQVDFKSLQNLIIGDPIRDGTVTDVVLLASSYLLSVADSAYLQRVNYARAAGNDLLYNQVNTRDPNGPQAILSFKDYNVIDDGRKFSISRNVVIRNGKDKYVLDMDIKDPEFNHPVEMPFSIPKSYKIKGE